MKFTAFLCILEELGLTIIIWSQPLSEAECSSHLLLAHMNILSQLIHEVGLSFFFYLLVVGKLWWGHRCKLRKRCWYSKARWSVLWMCLDIYSGTISNVLLFLTEFMWQYPFHSERLYLHSHSISHGKMFSFFCLFFSINGNQDILCKQ